MNVPSTRVLAAPGGNSNMGNLIFGGGYDKVSPVKQTQSYSSQQQSSQQQQEQQYRQQQQEQQYRQQQQEQQYMQQQQQQQQQMQQQQQQQMQQQAPIKSSTKVSQPPGGYSQGLW
jgi:hypothetical protein